MKSDIQAIVIDLDGTLLNRKKEISQRSIDILREVAARGLRVFIATGRSLHTCDTYINQIGINQPFICYNGSCIYDPAQKEDIYHTYMSETVCREILNIEEEVHCSFHAFRRHRVHIAHGERYASQTQHIFPHASTQNENISLLDSLEFTKAMFVGEFRETERVRAHLTHTFGEEVHQVYSRPGFFEVMRSGATKADALRRLLAREGIPASNVMAIGDENNDLGTLKLAGIPVAMANATREVKEVSLYETASCEEDGVAGIIEKLILE